MRAGASPAGNEDRSRLSLGGRARVLVPQPARHAQRYKRAERGTRSCSCRLARRAAILDADDPLMLTARGSVHTMAGDFDGADALLARALALDPSCGWAWGRSAWLHSYRGNSEVAIDHFRHALIFDPSATNANNFVGIASAQFGAGRYDAAAHWMHKALVEQPGMLWTNRTLSVSYARLRERRKALEIAGHVAPLLPRPDGRTGCRGDPLPPRLPRPLS